MQEITFLQLENLIHHNKVKYYNLYNLDSSMRVYFANEYYKEHSYDTPDIPLPPKILFLDIEVLIDKGFEFDGKGNAPNPVIAVSLCYRLPNNNVNVYILALKHDGNTEINKNSIVSTVKNLIGDNFDLDILLLDDEIELHKKLWEIIAEYDPLVLSGWNIDKFDIPYLISRLKTLNLDVATITRAYDGQIYEDFVPLPIQYSIFDLHYFYKPRDEGGLGYGVRRVSYSLNHVAQEELGIHKVEYEGNLDDLYKNNLTKFIEYNITDTILVMLLSEKLGIFELHNNPRRVTKNVYNTTLRGPSTNYDSYITYKHLQENKYPRFNILNERFENIPYEGKRLTAKDVRNIVCCYRGAYVHKTKPKAEYGLIVDLDYSSLYPSLIQTFNISYDTFDSYIIWPETYKFIDIVVNRKRVTSIEELRVRWSHLLKSLGVDKYSEKANKIAHIIYYYVNNIDSYVFNPRYDNHYIGIRKYFVNLVQLLQYYTVRDKAYNSIVYDYLYNPSNLSNYDKMYVIENILQPNIIVKKVTDIVGYLDNVRKSKILTISGAIFKKHEDKLGLFVDFLDYLAEKRKEYKAKMNEYEWGSENYIIYDRKQYATKVARNTTYGVYGLSGFRWSHPWLAETITLSGQMVIKLVQYLSSQKL